MTTLELMLYITLAIAFVATVCFFCGRAYCHRKHQPTREELRKLRKKYCPGPYYETVKQGDPEDA